MVDKSTNKTVSGGPSTKSIPSIRKFKPLRIFQLQMDNISVLIGKDNYQSWSDQMSMIFNAVRLHDVVVEHLWCLILRRLAAVVEVVPLGMMSENENR